MTDKPKQSRVKAALKPVFNRINAEIDERDAAYAKLEAEARAVGFESVNGGASIKTTLRVQGFRPGEILSVPLSFDTGYVIGTKNTAVIEMLHRAFRAGREFGAHEAAKDLQETLEGRARQYRSHMYDNTAASTETEKE